MNIRYRVSLSSEERSELVALVAGGEVAVRKIKRAQLLLAAAAGSTDEVIARNVGVGTSTVYRIKQRFVEEGLERALTELPRPRPERKLASHEEALLVAVACSGPPKGRSHWTLQLLADEIVALTDHESVSADTVGRLAEADLKPWQKNRQALEAAAAAGAKAA
jgi:transposase